MSALFEAEGLEKRFGARVVLQGVGFAVEEGEVHGIMGPNGAGKTTCFNVLTGRERPDGGRVRFAGNDITGASPRAIARLGIARSFQVMNLFDDFTALENTMTATRAMRAVGFQAWSGESALRQATRQAEEALTQVGLEAKAQVRARDLSYGDRRALEIAVALAAAPRMLFLDEPTAGLGADGVARIAALIGRLRGTLAMVVIEHDMRFLFGLADRISVVHWGQVIARGTPVELADDPWVRRSGIADANDAAIANA